MKHHAVLAVLLGWTIACTERTIPEQPCVDDMCSSESDAADTEADSGNGDRDSGDGDGDSGDGDGDSGDGDGDGDGDCQPGSEGCPCAAGACNAGLLCDRANTCVPEVCGDGHVAIDEQCDGDDLKGLECIDLGYIWGTLACDPLTCQFDTSACSYSLCGNGLVGRNEQCDGDNLDGFTCTDLGYTSGTLKCDPDCMFDASGCIWEPGPGD